MLSTTAVKERPILSSDPMVRAILAGRKTQMRTIVSFREFGPSDTPGYDWNFRGTRRGAPTKDTWQDLRHSGLLELCPYGKVGDRLWVRETWAYFGGDEYLYQRDHEAVIWRATWEEDSRKPVWHSAGKPLGDVKWRPSIHMPRWASRLTLEITDVRVQRLQEISEEDAQAEGMPTHVAEDTFRKCYRDHEEQNRQRIACFKDLWQKINGKGSWAANPWVWARTFRRVEVAHG